MRGNSPQGSLAHDCPDGPAAWVKTQGDADRAGPGTTSIAARERLSRLARTIESDVIPRLVQAHRSADVMRATAPRPTADDVQDLVADIVGQHEEAVAATLDRMRRRGLPVETLYLDLLAPAARHLGEMWNDDQCDFATVTVALGRLQCLLRELSPAFGTEVAHPPNGRRALFAQPREEQHSFGLSMVAEFFRRDGWEVIGGVGGAVDDPGARTRQEWVDVVGFSIGSELRLEWLRTRIQAVRESSRNRHIVVLCGGPIFTLHPQWLTHVGADATALDGREAPKVADRLLAAGACRR
ncbi:MAG: cobalamin B12-binding domain-containing protein [Rubrivivax sp.]|nr:cobalamin B12-binding domain-containing protein [Rubrivivax sp.]